MPKSPERKLNTLVSWLPQPQHQLFGRRGVSPVLPENIVCFHRETALELNRPRKGRALHHRFVLVFALKTRVGVCVDDREIRLGPGEGLLIFPFQFHHYVSPEAEDLSWLFITFEMVDDTALRGLRNQVLAFTPEIKSLVIELLSAYEIQRGAELPVLLLAVLLAKLRRGKPSPRQASGIVSQVNQLALKSKARLGLKEIAASLGISKSHLRARFGASCGVSLGRHLRQLRLDKACGLLRLGQQRVSEVAENCGFNSIYSFSRAFRLNYGVSPLAYRKGINPAVRRRTH